MVKIIAWNIAHRQDSWRRLLETDADVALLSEAAEPPADVAGRIEVDSIPWRTAGAGMNRAWRTAVVRLSDRVGVQWLKPTSLADAVRGELAVSRLGTLAAAIVTPVSGKPFAVVSMYAPWEKPHVSTGSGWIYADGSVHRIISDLSALVGSENGHQILAAGDLNILYGHGESGNRYWASRYATVFDRMAAVGLSFVGPQFPNGRRADPWPDELPAGTARNVPQSAADRTCISFRFTARFSHSPNCG